MPPDYWYDTTHSSNNANDDDSTLTNVGGSFGFDSEQGSGDTVPTMDSIQRFLSPADQATLWQQPDAHQYHTNYESTGGQHSGYSFGTLDNLDTAIAHRYGQWNSLAQYVQEAQVQNYEDTRAQFEAYLDHWNNYPTPSTGTVYWQLNKGWPTMLWDLYNYDYDEAGAYFGAKKANEDLHVLYAYDTGTVTIDNLTGVSQPGLSVQSRVYDLSGQVLDSQTASGLSLAPQGVQNSVLTPQVPAATTPPTPARAYFVELTLRQHGVVVDRNVYWMSTQQDVIDWDTTEGNPQANNGAPLSQYADMTALQNLPSEPVQVAAATSPGPGGKLVTSVTLTNPSSNQAVAFFLRADVRRGTAAGTALPGDNEVLPVSWSDNDVTLWPGQSQTLTATYAASGLSGATPVVSVYGWNTPERGVRRAAIRPGPGGRQPRAAHQGDQLLRYRKRHSAARRDSPGGQRGCRPGGRGQVHHVEGDGRRRPGPPDRRTAVVGHLGRELAGHHAVDQLHPGRQRRHLHADGDQHRPRRHRRDHAGDADRRGRPQHQHGLDQRVRLDLRHLQRPDRGLHRDRRPGRRPGRAPARPVLPAGHADGQRAADRRLRHPGLHVRAARDQRGHGHRRGQLRPVDLHRQRDAHHRPAGPDRGQRRGQRVPPGRQPATGTRSPCSTRAPGRPAAARPRPSPPPSRPCRPASACRRCTAAAGPATRPRSPAR